VRVVDEIRCFASAPLEEQEALARQQCASFILLFPTPFGKDIRQSPADAANSRRMGLGE
jgi:hypothetical protein